MRTVRLSLAWVIIPTLLLAGNVGSATAHDEECLGKLWALPVETLELPDGWRLTEAMPYDDGAWRLWLEGPGFGQLGQERRQRAIVTLSCVPALADFMAANERMDDYLDRVEFPATPVGDASRAYQVTDHSEPGYGWVARTIEWRRGDNIRGLAEVSEPEDTEMPVTWERLGHIALAVDALLG